MLHGRAAGVHVRYRELARACTRECTMDVVSATCRYRYRHHRFWRLFYIEREPGSESIYSVFRVWLQMLLPRKPFD